MKKLKYKSKQMLKSEISDMISHIDTSKDILIDLWFIVDEIKNKRKRIDISSRGTVDECEQCHAEFRKGVSAFDKDFNNLNVCNECLDKYYTIENE